MGLAAFFEVNVANLPAIAAEEVPVYLDLKEGCKANQIMKLPRGTIVQRLDVALKGTCPSCSKKKQNAN